MLNYQNCAMQDDPNYPAINKALEILRNRLEIPASTSHIDECYCPTRDPISTATYTYEAASNLATQNATFSEGRSPVQTTKSASHEISIFQKAKEYAENCTEAELSAKLRRHRVKYMEVNTRQDLASFPPRQQISAVQVSETTEKVQGQGDFLVVLNVMNTVYRKLLQSLCFDYWRRFISYKSDLLVRFSDMIACRRKKTNLRRKLPWLHVDVITFVEKHGKLKLAELFDKYRMKYRMFSQWLHAITAS